MAKTFNITNGTTAEIAFNELTGEFVMHHFVNDRILGMGRYKTEEDAVNKLYKLADMWGGYEVTEA